MACAPLSHHQDSRAVREVTISGIGAVTAYGVGWSAALLGLDAGRSAFDAPEQGRTLARVAAADAFKHTFPRVRPPRPGRQTQMLLLAAHEALGGRPISPPGWRVGAMVDRSFDAAVTAKMLGRVLSGGARKTRPLLFAESVANAPLGALALHLGARGPSLLTMGGGALYLAWHTLRAGDADSVLVGGLEELEAHQVQAFEDAGFVSDCGAPLPYDAASPGATLGEGAVALRLDSEGSGPALLAVGHATDPECGLRGWGPPSPAVLAALLADVLGASGVRPRELGAWIGGGNGTPALDAVEPAAMAEIGEAPSPRSLKGLLGETLGAGTCASVAWAAHRAEDGPVLVTNVDLHGQCFAAVVAGGEP